MVSRYPGYIPQLLTVGQPAQCEVIGSISEQMSVVRSCSHASGESQKLEIYSTLSLETGCCVTTSCFCPSVYTENESFKKKGSLRYSQLTVLVSGIFSHIA